MFHALIGDLVMSQLQFCQRRVRCRKGLSQGVNTFITDGIVEEREVLESRMIRQDTSQKRSAGRGDAVVVQSE